MKTLLFLSIILWAATAYADQRYNPYSNTWETTTNNTVLKYNAYENNWSYQHPASRPEYNAYENKWEYAAPKTQVPGTYGWQPSGEQR